MIFHIFESYHVTKSWACKLFAKDCRFIMGRLNDKYVGFPILAIGEIHHNQQLQMHISSQEHQNQMCLEHSSKSDVNFPMVIDLYSTKIFVSSLRFSRHLHSILEYTLNLLLYSLSSSQE